MFCLHLIYCMFGSFCVCISVFIFLCLCVCVCNVLSGFLSVIVTQLGSLSVTHTPCQPSILSQSLHIIPFHHFFFVLWPSFPIAPFIHPSIHHYVFIVSHIFIPLFSITLMPVLYLSFVPLFCRLSLLSLSFLPFSPNT